ncbi:Glu/Leu/Phe/Val dehydrogenase dimerization domain-containing protein [soil metagenome]
MLDLLKRFEDRKPEIIFEWNDPQTEATGWIVINSLRGGAAGGGTRMRKGLDRREVESLAKTMEVKFTVAGPPIGGAKSGINFDPTDPRKEGVLKRWYKAVLPVLKAYYGTGGDLFVDEIHEVIPITRELGLLHPQEGVVNGHFKSVGVDREERIQKLQEGVSMLVTDSELVPSGQPYRVADMITGYGVAESVIHFYRLQGESVKGKKVLVQGWGNVGAAAGYYLSQAGALLTGILDRSGGVLNENGFTHDEVISLFHSRVSNMFDDFQQVETINEDFWKQKADVFIPAAASRLVTQEQLINLKNNGIQVVACGANVPFADPEIFFGSIGRYADENMSLIPDFISNCGMARVFAYLMSNPSSLTAKGIFADVASTIHAALDEVHVKNQTKTNITATSFEIALKQLM